jgi:putative DNA primase/helicase
VLFRSIPTAALFFLIGGGSNGKSVFINTIANLVGKSNTSNVSFNKLSNEYYVLDLFQKMINISGETPTQKMTTTDIAKQVVAGDWVTGREPYKRVTKFRPYAKHYLAMNKLPQILDNSYGMDRRLFFIQFHRTFKGDEIDANLENKLSLELSGIFNWAIDGYNRLRENDFKLPKVSSMTLAKEEYRNELDSVRAFSRRLHRSDDPEDKLKFKDIYEAYVSFSERWKMDLEKRTEFRKILGELGFKIENSTKDSNQLYIFNARLISDEEVDDEE